MLTPEIQTAYIAVLEDELVLATGCTEPISVAYAAAKLRQILGALPEKVLAEVSGNILKNVNSVIVPCTGGLRGIKAAVAAGIIAGEADKGLQVIAAVPGQRYPDMTAYMEKTPIEVACFDTPFLLDIRLTGWAGSSKAIIRIAERHSDIVYIEKDNQILLDAPPNSTTKNDNSRAKDLLDLQDILDFASEVDLSLVAPLLERQIRYNSAIAEEGLKNNWGANIGSTLLKEHSSDIKEEARAWAAAGSDARMSGCDLPVVILSGSGNQGITASMPVYRYAMRLGATQEQLYRALIVSDLVTCYQKAGIGVLSAYCGAISAGVGAGAAIAYLLQGANYDIIAHTIVNAVAILSGTICDGAKPSCAAKIAAAVDAGILGYEMCLHGQEFKSGDGIVGNDVSQTVTNVGILAKEGMRGTDRTILKIMTQ